MAEGMNQNRKCLGRAVRYREREKGVERLLEYATPDARSRTRGAHRASLDWSLHVCVSLLTKRGLYSTFESPEARGPKSSSSSKHDVPSSSRSLLHLERPACGMRHAPLRAHGSIRFAAVAARLSADVVSALSC